MTCAHCKEADRVFKPWIGKSELKRYRKKGPSKSTQVLIEAVKGAHRKESTLIDIGGGVGAIYHELLDGYVSSVIHVDAADNYLTLARSESARRGTENRVEFKKGDFVDLSTELPPADIITLDKVVCCYPNIESLLSSVAAKSTGVVALSFPQEWLVLKIMLGVMNFFRMLRKNDFRNYVHPSSRVSSIFENAGFTQTSVNNTGIWQIYLFEKGTTEKNAG
ncbi:MAG: class I SAM-dependent methyltransferase [Leptospirales bacterium]